MADISTNRRSIFEAEILQFLKERLDAKLDKLADDDPKCDTLIAQYDMPAWLDDAARRVTQIQAVTHTLKPIHPDARGTNLHVPPDSLPARSEIGSHILGARYADDVVGNAAALDVYKFLKREVEGKSLLQWLLDGDPDLLAALSGNAEQAAAWAEAFAGLVRARGDVAASHTLAKQLYWLTGDDPPDNTHYQLLAPLYASSLAHALFQRINEDRFGDEGKEARQARREGREHSTGYQEYPGLAVQKFGGTKPQNISQLNSERGGNNYLLASLPPRWRSRTLAAPLRTESVFPRFGRREEVRENIQAFRKFLLTHPEPNVRTRNRVDKYLDGLIDELVQFAQEMQSGLPPGWSADAECKLADVECLWLDPGRVAIDPDFAQRWQWMDWPDLIGWRFGNWLNAQMDSLLPFGANEARQWRKELLIDESDDGWAARLHGQRRDLDAPTHIPTQGSDL